MRKRVNSPPFISFVSLPGKAGVHSKQTIALCLLIASLHFAYFSGAGGLLLRTSLLGKFQFRDPVHVALSRQTASSPSAGGVREASQMSVGHSYMSAGEKSHMSVGKEYAHQVRRISFLHFLVERSFGEPCLCACAGHERSTPLLSN